jgi:flagellar basal-body rod protein FlgB
MLNRLTGDLQFQAKALTLRAERQSVLAANIANADTPNFKARDFDFSAQLARATGASLPGATGPAAPATGSLALASPAANTGPGLAISQAGHLPASGDTAKVYGTREAELGYRVPDQASMDGNTVELDKERANFADNAVRYEATLRFINGNVRAILSAIRGE